MRRKITGALLALLLICAGGCGGQGSEKRFEAQFLDAFDTVTTVVGYSRSREEFTAQVQWIREQLMEYHRLYDIYNDYPGTPNLKTVNQAAGSGPVAVDRRILDLLEFSQEMYQATEGMVNVAMGSVLSIWHDYRRRGINDPENAALPPRELLEEAAKHTDIRDVVIDREASTVFLRDADMSLDVGAIAKGYAAEQVCRAAAEQGFDGLLVSVGGNLRAMGGKTRGQPWEADVRAPGQAGQPPLYTLRLADGWSLVTSGDYQRYYTVNGRRYHHIIHPRTLAPVDRFTAVVVLCDDSGRADAYSTALFNLELEEGWELAARTQGLEALWILPDGSVEMSGGFREQIIKD